MIIHRRRFLASAAVGSLIPALSPLASGQMSQGPKGIRAVAFDAFVLFDPRVVATRVEELFPEKHRELLNLWRTRQFEYTWLRTVGRNYLDFWRVTEDALTYSAKTLGLSMSAGQRERLMASYQELPVWPDVPKIIAELHRRGIRMAFLSNFTAEMIDVNLKAANLKSYFEEHLTTDRVNAFKPDWRAYQMAVDHYGVSHEEVAFAAFAPWDAAGAKWFGYPTVWVNRANAPREELGVTTDIITPDLSALLAFIDDSQQGR